MSGNYDNGNINTASSDNEMNKLKESSTSYGTADLPLQNLNKNPVPSSSPPPFLPSVTDSSSSSKEPRGIINTFFNADFDKSLPPNPVPSDRPETEIPSNFLSVPNNSNSIQLSNSQVSLYPSSTVVDSKPLLIDHTCKESSLRIIGEVLLPFLLAGLGCVFAGIILDIVKNWSVFREVSEIFILVPALLGLKGNLEMTLASRLSTQANLGTMDSRKEQWKMAYGNLALTQVQAIIVGLLASFFAIMLGWIPSGKFNLWHGLMLCASSVFTAVLATLILGSLMIAVVMVSRRLNINPDNVATPIAASLGDLTTITLLAFIAQSFYDSLSSHKWVCPTVLSICVVLIPLWWFVAHRNKYTNQVLYSGWVPVIGAMVISSLGGLVLDYAVVNFKGLAVFQPVINGVGGNLVAVQASRLSTALHKASTPGSLPENAVHGCPNPIKTFFSQTNSSRTSRVLMLMVIPGHLLFMLVIFLLQQTKDFKFSVFFCFLYLTAAIIQVAVLLYIADGLVHFLWAKGSDPDNSSIPYLTAIGDLIGTSLLALTFFTLTKFENRIQ